MTILRWCAAAAALVTMSAACATTGRGTLGLSTMPADSALIGRILLAEDRRDASDVALAEGVRSDDQRVRLLARRALARIRDPKFAARDSFRRLPRSGPSRRGDSGTARSPRPAPIATRCAPGSPTPRGRCGCGPPT
jgi:hypothetical protein